MQHQTRSDINRTTRAPSQQFICSVARLLKSDPTDILRELGYSQAKLGLEARSEENSPLPCQTKLPEWSDYYLG